MKLPLKIIDTIVFHAAQHLHRLALQLNFTSNAQLTNLGVDALSSAGDDMNIFIVFSSGFK